MATAKVKNSKLAALAQRLSPSFKAWTANGTLERFDQGIEANKEFMNDPAKVNEWFGVLARVVLLKIDVARAVDPLTENGLVAHYNQPLGDVVQLMSVGMVKPVEPKFRGLKNGDFVNDQIVRKPELGERFYSQNFDFSNWVTLQDYQIKTIFASEYGMSEVLGAIVEQLNNSYIVQRYYLIMQAIDRLINSTEFPLTANQKVSVTGLDMSNPTADSLNELIKAIQNTANALSLVPATGKYNAAGFTSHVDKSDYLILMRATIITEIRNKLRVGAYNPEDLALPFTVQPMPDFGGLIPTNDGSTEIFPTYDEFGSVNGFATTAGADTPTIDENDVIYKDPNAKVAAIIVQKGAILTTEQNPLMMPVSYPNARGVYQNHFIHKIGDGVHTDYYKNVITFSAA